MPPQSPSLPFSPPKLKNHLFPVGWHPRHPLCGASCPHRLEPPKNTVFLRAVRAARAYALDNRGSGGQVETTGRAQIVNALGMPFVLEGLFVD
jgi:hypothetical protein